jgi:hypothetical protein
MHKRNHRRDFINDELGERLEELSRAVGLTPRELIREAVEEFAASRKERNGSKDRTELGRRLRAIRARIVKSGEPLLDAAGLDAEIAERRGEREA